MFIILTLLVALHFVLNRRHHTWLLPSHLLLLLEFILQTIFPILVVAKTQAHSHYTLALFIVLLGFTSFFVSYRLPSLFKSKFFISKSSVTHLYRKLDPYLRASSLVLFWIGVFLILLVFANLKMIPALSSNTYGDARFFYNNPIYFKFFKYPYWMGITFISVASVNLFIFSIKEKRFNLGSIAPILIAMVLLLLTRHRGPFFALCLSMYVFYFQLNPKKLKFIYALMHISGAFATAMLMLFLREGSGGLIEWVSKALTHGSSFVDFHEFAESLALNDGKSLLLGKTYLGDLMSFIPSGLSDFRDTYRWKEWTKILFNAPPEAGGYRLTLFGESYFNFGLPGVVFQGALVGLVYRIWDEMILKLQYAYSQGHAFSVSGYYLVASYTTFASTIAANFYNISFGAAMLVGCLLIFLCALGHRDFLSRKYQTGAL